MSAPTRTTGIDYVAEFAAAADRFAGTIVTVDVRAPVPTCPGWTAYDLVTHLGNVHSWAATIVETGKPAADLNDEPHSRKPKVVATWYAGKAEDLYAVLRAADPDAPCWNFAFGTGDTGFWRRRQLHETLIHGVDLALASGRPFDPAVWLPAELAADGVDEALGVFLHRMHMRGYPAVLDAPMSLVATDVERGWTLRPRAGELVPAQPSPHTTAAGRPEAGEPRVSPGATAGTDRIEAPAAALYRLLWKRIGASDASIRYLGNNARFDRFLASRLTP